MLVLGLLLIIGAVLITVGAIYDAGEEATVEIVGQTLTTTAAGVFVAGAVTTLMFLVGVWALMASMGRAKRKRAARKEAKTRHQDSVTRLEEERTALRAENERLAEQLAARRTADDTTAADTTAADTHLDHDRDHDARNTSAAPDADGYRSDRVIDHNTDLGSHETSASGRRREL